VSTAQAACDEVRNFFRTAYGSTGAFLPTGITVAFPSNIDVVEPGTGALITSVGVTPLGNLVGSDSGTYAAPAGACVTWRTSGFVGGHRVRGRTFLVPVGQAGLQNDGTPATTFINNALSAANALIASAPELLVWHRPESLAAGGGEVFPVLAAAVNDKAAMLTSRR
jgi:hypothetical protein